MFSLPTHITYSKLGTWELGRKDYLYRNVYNMRRKRGEAFDFVPRFFVLPRDYDELQQDLDRFPGRMYIQKVWGRVQHT